MYLDKAFHTFYCDVMKDELASKKIKYSVYTVDKL